MIQKDDGKYEVKSESTGRSFGKYDTKEAATRRLRQIEYFKHAKESKK